MAGKESTRRAGPQDGGRNRGACRKTQGAPGRTCGRKAQRKCGSAAPVARRPDGDSTDSAHFRSTGKTLDRGRGLARNGTGRPGLRSVSGRRKRPPRRSISAARRTTGTDRIIKKQRMRPSTSRATGPPLLVLITGLSGSGKGSVLKAFEDLGFYSVDNLPIDLIPKFAELCRGSPEIHHAALVVDIREGQALGRLPSMLRALR